MKKRYTLDSGMDTSITLEIDTSKITAEIAAEINTFMGGGKEVLIAANGDVFEAVARRSAGRLVRLLLEGFHEIGSVAELSEQEGWPDVANGGITIVDHEIPTLGATDFEVLEIAA